MNGKIGLENVPNFINPPQFFQELESSFIMTPHSFTFRGLKKHLIWNSPKEQKGPVRQSFLKRLWSLEPWNSIENSVQLGEVDVYWQRFLISKINSSISGKPDLSLSRNLEICFHFSQSYKGERISLFGRGKKPIKILLRSDNENQKSIWCQLRYSKLV